MLLALILTVSLANIAVAFFAMRFLRGQQLCWSVQLPAFRLPRRKASPLATAAKSATGETEAEPRQEHVAADDELADESAQAMAGHHDDDNADDAATDSNTPRTAPSEVALEPSALAALEPVPGQTPLEDLFYRAARLADDLAEIDHSVLAGRAGEQPTEEKLAQMWPKLAEKANPIESLLQQVAKHRAADDEAPREEAEAEDGGDRTGQMLETGHRLVEHCRMLADEMDSAEKRAANSESGLHHLRDLFTLACEFRDQCEDLMAEQLGVDHKLYACGGRALLEQKVAELCGDEENPRYCAIGFEIDHLRELNSLYGAAIINALLNALQSVIESSLPACELICRRHGQQYVAIVEADGETASAESDRLRQQIGSKSFRFEDQTVQATVSGGVVPLAIAKDDLLERLAAAISAAKQNGYDSVVRDHGDHHEAVTKSPAEIEELEVMLQV